MKARVSFKTLLQVLLMALVLNAVAPNVLPGILCANASEESNGKRPTVLLILDGFGLSDETEHNAIAQADTPVLDRLMQECPFVQGNASGLTVGLPEGQMGSSEVGHLNTDAGRIVYQDLTRIAETEKYAHVTSFFNGGVEAPNEGEDRFLIPSPKVATYDLQPEMSASAVCDTLVGKIRSGEYDVIIANFANSDMVGHTGVEEAAIEAVECLDTYIGGVVEAIEEVDDQLFICADHGNAEVMVDDETGEPWTAHTANPIPFILVYYDPAYTLREGGCLTDAAPTLIG